MLPQGSLLGGRWAVGGQIGEGACARVYSVTNGAEVVAGAGGGGGGGGSKSASSSKKIEYVAKVIPLGKGKGKALKDSTRICNTLNYEKDLYCGVLVDFAFRPITPLKNYGDDAALGVRYLVMERLDQDLSSWARSAARSNFEIASIGLQILEGLEWMHRKGFLFVDVKPENFMLRGDKVCFVDFGLVERWVSYNSAGARQQVGTRAVVAGTPEFASLEVQRGKEPSRKDDCESLGMMLIALAHNRSLPWSHATSAADCLAQMERENIVQLATSRNCREAGEMIEMCRQISYDVAPNYAAFKGMLQQMKDRKVSTATASTSKSSSSKSKSGSSSSSSSSSVVEIRGGRAAGGGGGGGGRKPAVLARQGTLTIPDKHEEEEEEEEEKPGRTKRGRGKKSSPAKLTTVIEVDDEEDVVMESSSSASRGQGRGGGGGGGKGVNRAKRAASFEANEEDDVTLTSTSKVFLRAQSGPNRGELFPLQLSATTSTSATSKKSKSSSKAESIFTLGSIKEGGSSDPDVVLADSFVSEVHVSVKTTAEVDGSFKSMHVKDEGSTNGTRINGTKITKNKWVAVSQGDVIKVGQSELRVEVSTPAADASSRRISSSSSSDGSARKRRRA